MAAPAAPSDAELQAQADALKSAETKEGSGVDPAVLAHFKKTWNDNAGDKDKICAALSIEPAKWVDGMTEETFIGRFLGKV